MKEIPLKIELDQKKMEPAEKKYIEDVGVIGIFETLFNQTLQGVYPQGVPVSKGRILSRIQRRLDESEKDVTSLTVEDAEFDFIKATFSNEAAKFQPQQYRIAIQIIDAIESVK